MKIAVCQTEIVYEDKAANYEKAGQMLREAREAGAELALFPEMSFTGFSMRVAAEAEPPEGGETLSRMAACAREAGIAAGFGWAMRGAGRKARNQYTVVDAGGAVLCSYSKVHSFSLGREDRFYEGGEATAAFALGGLQFSIAVCYDARFPETFLSAADGGATAFVVPANWPVPRLAHWEALLPARAIDAQAYVVGVNCAGRQGRLEYPGRSAVYGPSGEALLRMGSGEGLGICELDAGAVEGARAAFPTTKDRKPWLYAKWYAGLG